MDLNRALLQVLLVAQTGRLGGLETSPGRKSLKTGSKVDDLLCKRSNPRS
jgi:hypothetical protein